MTSQLVNDVLTAANTIAPSAPIVEVADAAVSTAASPTPVNFLADIQLAITIISSIKTHLNSKDESLWQAVKGLF